MESWASFSLRTLVFQQHLQIFQFHFQFLYLFFRTIRLFLLYFWFRWSFLDTFLIGQGFNLPSQIQVLISNFLELFFELLHLCLILLSLLDSWFLLKFHFFKTILNFEILIFKLVIYVGFLLLHFLLHCSCFGLLCLQLFLYYHYFIFVELVIFRQLLDPLRYVHSFISLFLNAIDHPFEILLLIFSLTFSLFLYIVIFLQCLILSFEDFQLLV